MHLLLPCLSGSGNEYLYVLMCACTWLPVLCVSMHGGAKGCASAHVCAYALDSSFLKHFLYDK